jgi:hypothetical protein
MHRSEDEVQDIALLDLPRGHPLGNELRASRCTVGREPVRRIEESPHVHDPLAPHFRGELFGGGPRLLLGSKHPVPVNEIAEQPAENAAFAIRRQSELDRLVRIECADCEVQPGEGDISLADLEEKDLADLLLRQRVHPSSTDGDPDMLSLDLRLPGRVPERRHDSAAADDAPSDGPEAVDAHARRDRTDDSPFGRPRSCRA